MAIGWIAEPLRNEQAIRSVFFKLIARNDKLPKLAQGVVIEKVIEVTASCRIVITQMLYEIAVWAL